MVIDGERCKGCGLCVDVCSRENLRVGHALNAKGHPMVEVNPETACDGCRKCTDVCPDDVIEIRKSVEAQSEGTPEATPSLDSDTKGSR